MLTKVTVSLPEELSRRAKAHAALEGMMLTQVIRERLDEFAAGLDALEEADDIRLVEEIRTRLATGEERLYTHQEIWSEIDTLESRGELPR